MVATWGHRPHNFLAVGVIAPIKSALMDSTTFSTKGGMIQAM